MRRCLSCWPLRECSIFAWSCSGAGSRPEDIVRREEKGYSALQTVEIAFEVGIAKANMTRYMSLFFAFSIAGAFLPLILQAKGVDTKQSQAETYRSYVWICKSPCVEPQTDGCNLGHLQIADEVRPARCHGYTRGFRHDGSPQDWAEVAYGGVRWSDGRFTRPCKSSTV